MQNLRVGDSSQASITVPTVPGLSPSTVEMIYRMMRRRGERAQRTVVKAFYEVPEGAIMFALDRDSGVLAWSYGERPPLTEVIRSVEEILAAKVDAKAKP